MHQDLAQKVRMIWKQAVRMNSVAPGGATGSFKFYATKIIHGPYSTS